MPSIPNSDERPHVISISTTTFIKAVAIVLGLGLLWFLRDTVAIFFAALLLSALIDPFADTLARHKIPRGLAVMIVYAVLGAIATLVCFMIVPVVIEQGVQLLSNFGISTDVVYQWTNQVKEFIRQGNITLSSLTNFGGFGSLSSLVNTVMNFIGWIGALTIVLVLTFYMVVEEDAGKKYFKSFAPAEYRPYLSSMMDKMQEKIGAWLRGQLILGLVIGIAVYIGLTILGVKYALLLAVIAGLLEIVPYLGPILSVIPSALVGFADSWVKGLFVILLYIVIQQIENNILVPKIMQKVTGLNPIVSIMALMIGIQIGGFIGAILSIPVATMVTVLLEDLFADRSAAANAPTPE